MPGLKICWKVLFPVRVYFNITERDHFELHVFAASLGGDKSVA
jgi:hypothetical protein